MMKWFSSNGIWSHRQQMDIFLIQPVKVIFIGSLLMCEYSISIFDCRRQHDVAGKEGGWGVGPMAMAV